MRHHSWSLVIGVFLIGYSSGIWLPRFASKDQAGGLRRDPASADRWCDLGETFWESGNRQAARYCYLRAVERGPNAPLVRLRAANFFFSIEETSPALQQASHLLNMTPDYDAAVFSSYTRLGPEIDQVLEHGLPGDRRSAQSYFRYLLAHGTPQDLPVAWKWLLSRCLADDPLAAEYVAFWLKEGKYELASGAWEDYLGPHRGEYRQTNYLWNPSFQLAPTGCRFDWSFRKTPAAQVTFSRPLVIRFLGSENVAFEHLSQTVFLAPGHYRLRARVRAEGLTTDEGLAFRILGPALDVRTDAVSGTTPWTTLKKDFSISRPSLLEIQAFRQPSAKFDKKITGAVFLDAVELSPRGI
ncbi:MAG: hypothetical protein HY238_16580 [Acidobacteria bacterium]|nr:hypothetical protein [Acidobacteriota bacterium]